MFSFLYGTGFHVKLLSLELETKIHKINQMH